MQLDNEDLSRSPAASFILFLSLKAYQENELHVTLLSTVHIWLNFNIIGNSLSGFQEQDHASIHFLFSVYDPV